MSEAKGEKQGGDWAARTHGPRRSVFGNFTNENHPAGAVDAEVSSEAPFPLTPALFPGERDQRLRREKTDPPRAYSPGSDDGFPLAKGEGQGEGEQTVEPLQAAIDTAVARSFLYRFVAKVFEDPTPEGWATLTEPSCQQSFLAAIAALSKAFPVLADRAGHVAAGLRMEAFDDFHSAYLNAFGHAARGSCPLNEIEYGDIKADGLYQPHRLADLAAFYQAFGLELAADAGERQDHLGIELEFMSVLASKEAYALEHQLDEAELELGRSAQRKFLHEHLGRWVPAFSRRLAVQIAGTPLAPAAGLLRAFIEAECARFQVTSGSEDLLLRPVDEASESLCASCGSAPPLPGSLAEVAGATEMPPMKPEA